jgi:hypothetical protein
MKDNQREEIAYLAGLFDGEGTICIQKMYSEKYMTANSRVNPGYTVCIRIGMIDKEAIEHYLEFFKVGQIHCEKIYHAKRPVYRWQVRAQKDVRFVIETLMPYLRVKIRQVHLAIKWLDECLWKSGMSRKHGWPPELVLKREDMRLEMQQLNGIDISPATTKRTGIMGRTKGVRVEAIV